MIELTPKFRIARGSETYRAMMRNIVGWELMTDIERNVAHKRLGYADYTDRKRWSREDVARYLHWSAREVLAVELSAFSKLLSTG